MVIIVDLAQLVGCAGSAPFYDGMVTAEARAYRKWCVGLDF